MEAPHEDALVIEAIIHNFKVQKVLIDNGSKVNLLSHRYATFLIIKLPMLYNAILGQPKLYDFEVATSIKYLMMKFPTKQGITTVRGRQEEA
ncbi:hypothetical protein P3X46_004502 [Hevea brasiliensis]|uniref:Uncharacterized protein n=1 Tax=Hevea brasiliensis TaxID=3981 RepID=A0ABQ9MYD5_HEVBR|nr:hypothetical protein P3X46_004502 [Hevea brasiliensis]